ncbi:hypothetical protein HMPREF9946_03322 [Acetobacteraceae bacterium AT-5844]|nr:hypothetical protein HMPREF9946_03322 [Acetobacteraceae bacterium AT-5844]
MVGHDGHGQGFPCGGCGRRGRSLKQPLRARWEAPGSSPASAPPQPTRMRDQSCLVSAGGAGSSWRPRAWALRRRRFSRRAAARRASALAARISAGVRGFSASVDGRGLAMLRPGSVRRDSDGLSRPRGRGGKPECVARLSAGIEGRRRGGCLEAGEGRPCRVWRLYSARRRERRNGGIVRNISLLYLWHASC